MKRPRGWRVAALLALLATGALLAVAGKLDHLHGRWVGVLGWVMVGCAAIPGIAEKWSQERGRGPLLPKWLRVVTLVLLVYGSALLITQSMAVAAARDDQLPVARTRAHGGSRTAAPAFPALFSVSRIGLEALRPAQRHYRQLAPNYHDRMNKLPLVSAPNRPTAPR